MAVTVRELIAWLSTQDQDATVEVLCGVRSRGWEGDSYRRVDFDPAEHAEYIDLRGNQFVKPDSASFNARTLFLGGED